MKNIFEIVLIYLVSVNYVYLQRIPQNPCPNVFQYFTTNEQVYGRIQFENDNSGSYYLSVNMSVAEYLRTDQKLKLQLETSATDLVKGAAVVYYVHFPSQNVIPKPTQITFNQKLYCASPPEDVRPGGVVANLWVDTFFKVVVKHHGPNAQKPIEAHIITDGVQQPGFNALFTFEPWNQNNKEVVKQLNGDTVQFQFMPLEEITSAPEVNWNFPSGNRKQFTFIPKHQTEAPIATPSPVDFSECGQPSIIAIHSVRNGGDVEEGQFPWMTAVMYKSEEAYAYRCTGTLVSNRHVITAGHCLQYGKAPLFPTEDLMVAFGVVNHKNVLGGSVTRNIKEIFTHPSYVQDNADNDVSVLKLTNPVEFSKNVRPVCLWGDESRSLQDIVGKEASVAGWKNDQDTNYLNAKRSDWTVMSHNTCLQLDSRSRSITSARTFCAEKRNNGGPCVDDSGAGLVMFRNGRWHLRGVTSIPLKESNNCGTQNYFVFVDLAQIQGWLQTVLV